MASNIGVYISTFKFSVSISVGPINLQYAAHTWNTWTLSGTISRSLARGSLIKSVTLSLPTIKLEDNKSRKDMKYGICTCLPSIFHAIWRFRLISENQTPCVMWLTADKVHEADSALEHRVIGYETKLQYFVIQLKNRQWAAGVCANNFLFLFTKLYFAQPFAICSFTISLQLRKTSFFCQKKAKPNKWIDLHQFACTRVFPCLRTFQINKTHVQIFSIFNWNFECESTFPAFYSSITAFKTPTLLFILDSIMFLLLHSIYTCSKNFENSNWGKHQKGN